MQHNKMDFILLQPGRKARIINLVDDIHEFHKVLDCRCIDIVRRSFGGITCDVICDDEGLLAQKHPCSFWLDFEDKSENDVKVTVLEALVGSLLLCDCDFESGELIEHPRIDELECWFELQDSVRQGLNWVPYIHSAPK